VPAVKLCASKSSWLLLNACFKPAMIAHESWLIAPESWFVVHDEKEYEGTPPPARAPLVALEGENTLVAAVGEEISEGGTSPPMHAMSGGEFGSSFVLNDENSVDGSTSCSNS